MCRWRQPAPEGWRLPTAALQSDDDSQPAYSPIPAAAAGTTRRRARKISRETRARTVNYRKLLRSSLQPVSMSYIWEGGGDSTGCKSGGFFLGRGGPKRQPASTIHQMRMRPRGRKVAKRCPIPPCRLERSLGDEMRLSTTKMRSYHDGASSSNPQKLGVASRSHVAQKMRGCELGSDQGVSKHVSCNKTACVNG